MKFYVLGEICLMEERNRLGQYCIDHNITLTDLQQFSNQIVSLRTEQLDREKKHFQRLQNVQKKILISGSLVIDMKNMQVKREGYNLILPEHEFLILCLLVSNPHEVVSDKEIMKLLDNYGHKVGYRSMVVYLSRLSKKIGDSPIDSKYIKRRRNMGYYWDFVSRVKA